MKKSDIWIVVGHNGDWGHTVLGLYPTRELADQRCDELRDKMEFEFVGAVCVEAGQYGVDCEILIR